MRFNEDNKIADWHLLTKDEAEAYIEFLEEERYRHEGNIFGAEWVIEANQDKSDIRCIARIRLWASAIRRHRKDIIEIDHLVKMVSHWFKLNNKEGQIKESEERCNTCGKPLTAEDVERADGLCSLCKASLRWDE